MQSTTDLFERIRFGGQPAANPASVVISGSARFTVLAPRLLRLEWSDNGQFEDRGTFAFPTRFSAAPPQLTTRQEGRTLVIDTGELVLRYLQDSSKFLPHNLSITFSLNGKSVSWTPGTPGLANLRGTRRTVDGCEGDAALDEGILSRSGWALFDDSRSVVFNHEDGWVAPRPEHAQQDWYFFGYGHDYPGALAEYMRFGGKIPLIPRFVLGAWWSRYWAYSTQDMKDIVAGFEQHDLPLDVFVIDMDWHLPNTWTGYTWNRNLIPDPPALLDWLHKKGLKVTLNLHPAQGVQHFEEAYPEFARQMGVDPASQQDIPFRITDKRFVRSYFELLHHPLEDMGVNFWWVDWQQGDLSEMKGLDPLVWLNHIHFQDTARHGGRRMVYSRWGGLGNHRYQTGFSGDTVVGWPALQFQPYFTATASNVGYGWWEHDIGGHMGGATEPELFARWVQFGALSPALKLHGTKDPLTERRPWMYPEPVFEVIKAAFRWRYQLAPYIYTMARLAADTGVSLCRPMYYNYPEAEDAYAARYQYFFGDQMIAAPIVFPADPANGLAATDVWVPEGDWVDYTTKEVYTGPGWVRLVGGLARLPMLMKPGAILPLAPDFRGPSPRGMASGNLDLQDRSRMLLAVFPGKEGRFRLYEDDSSSENYQQGECEWTEITTRMPELRRWEVHIAAAEGHCPILPEERAWEIHLEASRRPERILVDGVESQDWRYQPSTLTTVIPLPLRSKREVVTIEAIGASSLVAPGKARNRSLALADAARLLGTAWRGSSPDSLMAESLEKCNGDAVARLGGPPVRFIEFITPEETAQQLGRVIVGGPVRRGETYDLEAEFTLYQSGGPVKSAVQLTGLTGSRILDTPFAFTGKLTPLHWEAEVKIVYRGATLTFRHTSAPLVLGIPAFRALIYNPEQAAISMDEALQPATTPARNDWKTYLYDPRRFPNLRFPYYVPLWEDARPRLETKEPLAAYLVTTITSPVEQEATLLYLAAGAARLYFNGKKVSQKAVEAGELAQRYLPQRMSFISSLKLEGLHLKAGKNTLLVFLRPAEKVEWRPWFFGGILLDPQGQPMTDLSYSAE
jgi:alpha-glucosidase